MKDYNEYTLELFINDLISINLYRYQVIPNIQDAWDFLYSEFTRVLINMLYGKQ